MQKEELMIQPLPREFYNRDTVTVARELLGKPWIRFDGNQHISGIIIETEAYQADDEACHGFKGLTKRSAQLFGEVGLTYVYLSYGIHYCLNVVARDTAKIAAGGVLIRGIYQNNSEKIEGHYIVGPGKSAAALSIRTEHNGIDVTQSSSPLIIGYANSVAEKDVQITPRIGITKNTEKLWRFYYSPY